MALLPLIFATVLSVVSAQHAGTYPTSVLDAPTFLINSPVLPSPFPVLGLTPSLGLGQAQVAKDVRWSGSI
jgi:hypothetical protein